MNGIRIKLLLTPNLDDMLRDLSPRLELVVPEGTTVREIIHKAGIPQPAVYTVIQGRAVLDRDAALSNDTELTLLAPIAGG